MRTFVIAACVAAAGCARGGAGADSAAAAPRDSVIVPGPAAIPATQVPAGQATPPAAPATASTTPRPGGSRVVPFQSPPESLRAEPPAPPAAARTDSVRGIVSVTGTSFEKHVMVAESGTRRRVEITGPVAKLVGHVSGAEVVVTGALSGTQLAATRFIVRSVDGQPAIDGTLKTEGGALYIVTADGKRTRIASPPPPLVGQDGARVWITGDPARGVSSFGFIDPPR